MSATGCLGRTMGARHVHLAREVVGSRYLSFAL
jgi:hypothetical protein